MSILQQALGRVRRQPAEAVRYALGRFHNVRRFYSLARHVGDQLGGPQVDGSRPTLFPDVDVEAAVGGLTDHAVAFGFDLTPALVAELREIADTFPCIVQADPPVFFKRDVRDGRLPNGNKAILARVIGAESTEPVRRIAEDPRVLDVIHRYLGYRPKERLVRLMWSFVNDVEDRTRKADGQTVDYHFDVASFNFLYANYYISDVDEDSGAHAMIASSHRHKPLPWLFGSANRPNADVLAHYGRENELVVVGPAGIGFMQDASCYHKALAPKTRERLMLQVRYT